MVSRRNGVSRMRMLGATFLIVVGSSAVATASEGWQTEPYPYAVVEANLRDVLDDFGRNTGVAMRISDEVRGQVRGEPASESAQDFLDQLTKDHGLVWYYDGFVVDISTRGELRTEVMDATGVTVAKLEEEMDALGVLDRRFDLRGSENTGLAFVSGPPRYVELVQQTLGRLREIAAKPVAVVRGSGGSGGSIPLAERNLNAGVIQ